MSNIEVEIDPTSMKLPWTEAFILLTVYLNVRKMRCSLVMRHSPLKQRLCKSPMLTQAVSMRNLT